MDGLGAISSRMMGRGMRQSRIATGRQWPDEGGERVKKGEETKGNANERSPGVTVQGLFFIIDLLGTRGVLQHVFRLSEEYLAPPERHKGEEEEDSPSDTHEDDHDAVPHDEPGEIKDIRQEPNDGDETHIWKPTMRITNRFGVSGAENGRVGENTRQARKRQTRKLT